MNLSIKGLSCDHGEGVRFIVEVSDGDSFTVDKMKTIIDHLSTANCTQGITILTDAYIGKYADELLFLIGKVCQTDIERDVWLYSEYTYEELMANHTTRSILYTCDVLIDGPYIPEKKDCSLSARDSTNQRIINVQESIESKSIVIWAPTIE